MDGRGHRWIDPAATVKKTNGPLRSCAEVFRLRNLDHVINLKCSINTRCPVKEMCARASDDAGLLGNQGPEVPAMFGLLVDLLLSRLISLSTAEHF